MRSLEGEEQDSEGAEKKEHALLFVLGVWHVGRTTAKRGRRKKERSMTNAYWTTPNRATSKEEEERRSMRTLQEPVACLDVALVA